MSVHLQRVRLFATTKDQGDAGTDDGVELWFWVPNTGWTTYPTTGWNSVVLDHAWDDRERGRTECYEVDLTIGNIGINISGTEVPRGVAFSSFAEARTMIFLLRTLGDDWWRIDHYFMLGYYQELDFVEGTIDSFRTIDHGWLLIARNDADVDMSTDPREGGTWHHIQLNGTFQMCEGPRLPLPWLTVAAHT